jgi:tetratricopeptide (TPR) repeat protein
MLTPALKIDKILNTLTVLIAFSLPLFFLPLTGEFFEFNKLTLLITYTIVICLLWCTKLVLTKKVNVVRSPINAPLLALLAVFFLSTIFSLDTTTSVFGSYGRWFPSLFGIIVLVGFYYITAANSTKDKTASRTLSALIAAGTISSTVALLSYFGIYLGSAPYLQTPNFNLAGSTTTTAIFAGLALILAIGYLLNTKNTPVKVLLVQAAVINFILLALYNTTAAWVLVGTSLIILGLTLSSQKIKESIAYIVVMTAAIVAFALMLITPQTSELIVNKNFGRDIHLPYTTSWKVVSTTISDFPILGSGPGTFSLNYTRYKPLSMNATDMWNIRFDKPHNELFDILGSVGIVGLLVTIYFGAAAAGLSLKAIARRNESTTTMLLGITIIGMLSVMLTAYATVVTSFILILLLALLSARLGEHAVLSLAALNSMSIIGIGENRNVDTSNREVLHYVIVIPMVALLVLAGYYQYRAYAAERFMYKSAVSEFNNNWAGVYDNQILAIEMLGNKWQRAEYQNTYARTNIIMAEIVAGQEALSEEQKQELIEELIGQAIRSTRLSTEALNPLLAVSWEIRAGIYNALRDVAEDGAEWSLAAYNNAIQLDPNNPRLRLEAGGIYYANEDYLTAANLFRQAANLKPDYANARYNLAQALIKLENYALAITELDVTARLLTQDSEDYELVISQLEELKQTADLGDTKPSVQDLEGDVPAGPTVQEPLTSPEQQTQLDALRQRDLDEDGGEITP